MTPPPAAARGALAWLRANLFAGWASTLATLVIAFLALRLVPPFVEWAFVHAVWVSPDGRACRAAEGTGACWALVAERWRFILFGTYPYDLHWRPALASVALGALYFASVVWAARRPRALAWAWLGALAVALVLMHGGVLGLAPVETDRWGGLALTLVLSTAGLAAAFPIAVALALARRSTLPVPRALAVAYIELVRGVPLISLLFMASVMLPFFMPGGVTLDKLLRAQIALIAFAAAYLAEAVRGGLQAIPRGQYEAAAALGLSWWGAMRRVILPQALRIAVPPIVGTFIGFFKDTSLVLIIGLYDLLSAVKVSLTEPKWSGFGVEAYLFAAVVYFAFCYAMSRASRGLES